MIRPYKLSDRQQLIDVFTLNVPAYFDPKEIGDYKGYLDEYSETYFTIEHQGSVVGGIGYYITEVNRSGSITWIFIDPEHAGHGLGKLAVEHCLAILREDEHVDKLVVQTSLYEGHVHMVNGGYEYDGRLINALDEVEIRTVLSSMNGVVDTLAITGIFSKTNPEQELTVAKWAEEEIPNVRVSLSHVIGGLGLLERENATILNASLQTIAEQMASSFEQAVSNHNINAKLYFGQNDGTLMSVDNARKFPVLTIACGPTNSIRGAGALSGINNGIVIDVGGTTTDAGILVNGFPRESSRTNNIGGVKTNFRMPDVLSIGLGGGSIIRHAPQLTIGPDSVGYQLSEKGLAFGGDVLTMTDYAIVNDAINIEETKPKVALQKQVETITGTDIITLKQSIHDQVSHELTLLLDKLKTENVDLPVILVGGGSVILPDTIEGASEVIKPPHYEVANAFGACIAKVGGEAEQVFNTMTTDREEAIEAVKSNAISIAQEAGADVSTIEVITIHETPLAYLPNMTKIKVKVCGDLVFV